MLCGQPRSQRGDPYCRLRLRERSGCGGLRGESRATRRQGHWSLSRSTRVSAKQLQLLRELVPGLTRVAVLFDAAVASAQRESVEGAARRLGVTIAPIAWRGPDTLPAALQSATQGGARGLIVLSSPHIQGYRLLVADAVLKRRLPAVALLSSFARDGLLITYGPVQRDLLRIGANLVAKILDGAPPAGLPIERPVRYALVIIEYRVDGA
jgi:putative tryptophan/tyrosine transport system substrate-binding protein